MLLCLLEYGVGIQKASFEYRLWTPRVVGESLLSDVTVLKAHDDDSPGETLDSHLGASQDSVDLAGITPAFL